MILDLKKSSIDKHWSSNNPRFKKVISIMENTEYWTVDSAQAIEMSMDDLSNNLNDASKETLKKENIADKLTYLFAYCSTGRALRFINWVDEKHSISLFYITKMRQKNDWKPAQIMLDRLRVVKKIALMEQVFSPTRLNIINKMLDS